MSKLREYREKFNLTQEELMDKSGISVRTIQRIEAGIEPKGQTLKILAKTLGIDEKDLLSTKEPPAIENTVQLNYLLIKVINLSSLPFAVFPPLNIIIPLIIMFTCKQLNPITKQLLNIQILWTISSVIIFMLSVFTKNWLSLGNQFNMAVMIVLVLSNVFIILRNAAEIDKRNQLYFKLKFSII